MAEQPLQMYCVSSPDKETALEENFQQCDLSPIHRRGYMVPAADVKWDLEAYRECYYLSKFNGSSTQNFVKRPPMATDAPPSPPPFTLSISKGLP